MVVVFACIQHRSLRTQSAHRNTVNNVKVYYRLPPFISEKSVNCNNHKGNQSITGLSIAMQFLKRMGERKRNKEKKKKEDGSFYLLDF